MHRLKYNYETTDNRHVFNVCYKTYIKQKEFFCTICKLHRGCNRTKRIRFKTGFRSWKNSKKKKQYENI